MAYFVRHDSCPQCRKLGKDRNGNNLGIYSDGSEYCFSCGYHNRGSVIRKTSAELQSTGREPTRTIGIPGDCDGRLPEKAWEWLKSYSLTETDVIKNNILWSEQFERVVFPILDDIGNLLAWQGRYLGDLDKPKWFTQGDLKNLMHILGPKSNNTCVLVEDLISAIRVSNTGVCCMPIFGSHISLDKLRNLKILNYQRILIWLDKDKQIDSLKFSRQGQQLGINTRSIITTHDPKAYTKQEIKSFLTEV